MTKPSKYLHEKQIWYKFDRFNKCNRKIYLCPKGYKGHYTEILSQTHTKIMINAATKKTELFLKVDQYIHHSHFIADLDKGRHVRCKIGTDYISVHDPKISRMFRLGRRNPPSWIIEEINS